ncbi:MAG: MFS transporter [Roseibacillus sp.]
MPVVPSENPARRTFLLDSLRALPGGCVETLGLVFVVLIAVRVFDAAPWQKATLVAASSFGLLLSLFPVQLVRRRGWSVNVTTACLWCVAGAALAVTAIGGRNMQVFLPFMVFALLCITLSIPLMSQIYRKHYPDNSRGRLFAFTGVVRKASALIVAALFGRMLESNLDNFRWLLVAYAVGCVAMAACVLGMERTYLRRANQIRLFGALDHVVHDKVFRQLLTSWMILGFGNLLCFSLFVEYISNPAYGYELEEFTIAFITGSVPEIMFLIFVVGWGIAFDRVNFFIVRIVLNVLFMAGILIYFLGNGVWALYIGMGLHGVGRAGGNIAWSLWVTKFAKGEQVAEYMSVHTFLCGVRGVIAPYLAFPAIALFGPKAIGMVGAGLILIASLMLWPNMRIKGKAAATPVEPDPRAS